MVDRQAVGFRGPEFEFPLEKGKIREMARAMDSRCDEYFGDDPPVPPTFLKLAQFVWEPAEGSAIGRVGYDPNNPPLHAEQEFVFDGPPPRAGEVLTAQTVVESIEDKPSRRFGRLDYITMVTEFRNAEGRIVGQARTTSVAQP
jgi:hypothetical protein